MKREFLITVSFCICKNNIKEPEGSALGFVVNYAPLSTWVRSVILSFRVVTRWAVSTAFSQVSLPRDVSEILGHPGALVQVGSPP